MKNYSKKRLESYMKKYESKITKSFYIPVSGPGKGILRTPFKDKRSKNFTKRDIKLAKQEFSTSVQSIMRQNPKLTTIEAAQKLMRTTRYTSREEIAKENMQKVLKDFGYNVQKRSLSFDGELDTYIITRGKYKGYAVEIVRDPTSDPSYRVELRKLTDQQWSDSKEFSKAVALLSTL